jgi:putative transposase
MKKSRYSEEQIVRVLQEVEGGKSVSEVAREKGVTEATVYRWRQRYGGLSRSELTRLRELEQENTRLKRIVAQQAMDIDGLRELVRGKW